MESPKDEVAALARKYVQQAELIPIPVKEINNTLNMLSRSLHYCAIALEKQMLTSTGKDLLQYRNFLARIRPVLDQQKSIAPDLIPMVTAKCTLLTSALDILESGASISHAIQPLPDQIALWADLASNKLSGGSNQASVQSEEQKMRADKLNKTIEDLERKLAIANAKTMDACRDLVSDCGYERTINIFLERKDDNESTAVAFLAICEELERALRTTTDPQQLAKLMIICTTAWVERELLSTRHPKAAELLRQESQRIVKGGL